MKIATNYNSRKCEIRCQSNQKNKCKKFFNKFRVDISQLNFRHIKILKNISIILTKK